MLSDELGLEPGPALRELEAKVLEHSPELAPPARAPTDGGAASSGPRGPSEVAAPHRRPPRRRRRPRSGERPLLAFGRRHRVAMLTDRARARRCGRDPGRAP